MSLRVVPKFVVLDSPNPSKIIQNQSLFQQRIPNSFSKNPVAIHENWKKQPLNTGNLRAKAITEDRGSHRAKATILKHANTEHRQPQKTTNV